MIMNVSDWSTVGEMSEWFKELVLKTSDSQEPWVRIPLSPPLFSPPANQYNLFTCSHAEVPKWL